MAIFLAQFVHQCGGKAALGGAQRVGVPLACVAVIDRYKGGLAAHGQAHVARDQFTVHGIAQCHHVGPLLFGVGFGDAGRFINASDLHVVAEFDLALVHTTFDGGRARGLGCAGQRNVAFAGHQARGCVQANPACAG